MASRLIVTVMNTTFRITCGLWLVCAFAAKSQPVPADSVPEQISSQFAPLFPDAKNAEWVSSGEYFVVHFVQNKKHTKAFFDIQGNMLWTEVKVTESELPQQAHSFLRDHYGKSRILSVGKLRSIDGVESFEVVIGADSLRFDPQGQLIKSRNHLSPR